VRGIVKVVTAVATASWARNFKSNAKGEIAALGETLNNMTKPPVHLRAAGHQRGAHGGVEGKLGAQAEVPGVAGTWKDLTDTLNLLDEQT